jgi:hypothetical protein
VAEVLRAIIGCYKDLFKATLTDAILFSNYAQTVLVIDEVCKEVRHTRTRMDRAQHVSQQCTTPGFPWGKKRACLSRKLCCTALFFQCNPFPSLSAGHR